MGYSLDDLFRKKENKRRKMNAIIFWFIIWLLWGLGLLIIVLINHHK